MSKTSNTAVRPKNTGQKVIFNNPVLESLTRTHIAVPISIFHRAGGICFYVFSFAQLPDHCFVSQRIINFFTDRIPGTPVCVSYGYRY